jgi:hypothetical protein
VYTFINRYIHKYMFIQKRPLFFIGLISRDICSNIIIDYALNICVSTSIYNIYF